jgi:hypothetical protein
MNPLNIGPNSPIFVMQHIDDFTRVGQLSPFGRQIILFHLA